MGECRGDSADPPRGTGALAILVLLFLLGGLGCGEDAAVREPTRGRGLLVAPHAEITTCRATVYEGPGTQLYSNRPYHTRGTASVARGLTFCRGDRHGTNVWSLEVFRPTRLVAFGYRGNGLEDRGWTASEEGLEVEAAGVALNQIYTRPFPVGRYVIRQGFTPAAPIVLWDAAAARPTP